MTLTGASREMSRQQYVPCSEADILRFFGGLEPVAPVVAGVKLGGPGGGGLGTLGLGDDGTE